MTIHQAAREYKKSDFLRRLAWIDLKLWLDGTKSTSIFREYDDDAQHDGYVPCIADLTATDWVIDRVVNGDKVTIEK